MTGEDCNVTPEKPSTMGAASIAAATEPEELACEAVMVMVSAGGLSVTVKTCTGPSQGRVLVNTFVLVDTSWQLAARQDAQASSG